MTAILWHRLRPAFLDQLEAAVAAGRFAEFHFDDGYDDIDRAADALEARGLRGVFFIVPGWLGLRGQATSDIVRDLHRRGHVIANHTFSHPTMTKIPKAAALWELRRGARELEAITGERPARVAWPYGLHDERLDAIAAELGLKARGIAPDEVWVAERNRPGPGR